MINAMNFRDISYRVDKHGIATLEFNTPKRKNALSALSFYEIYLATEAFEQDDSAYALILTGARDAKGQDAQEAFSSGGYFNADAFDGVANEVLQQIDLTDIAQKRTTLKLFDCDKPIIAAVNGYAIGGAMTLILAVADQIYLSEHAWFQLPFAKLGISAELASSFLLPRLLGMQKAKEILFFSERISAQQAVDLQLANAVLAHDELMPFAYRKARQLVPPEGASLSIRAMKRLLNQPLRESLSQALDLENTELNKLMNSRDFKEGVTARIERRAPVFEGR